MREAPGGDSRGRPGPSRREAFHPVHTCSEPRTPTTHQPHTARQAPPHDHRHQPHAARTARPHAHPHARKHAQHATARSTGAGCSRGKAFLQRAGIRCGPTRLHVEVLPSSRQTQRDQPASEQPADRQEAKHPPPPSSSKRQSSRRPAAQPPPQPAPAGRKAAAESSGPPPRAKRFQAARPRLVSSA